MAEKIVNIEDMRRQARRKLPRMIFDFLEGGALDELTLQDNTEDLVRLRLRQRVLRDMSEIEPGTRVLGQRLALPVMISPLGMLSLFHPQADLAFARAAERAGTVLVHSAWSACSLEEVVAAAPKSIWAQISFWTDAGLTREHVDRAEAAGVEVLVVAGDVNLSSKRERDLHHGMALPPRPTLRDVVDTGRRPGWLARLATGRRPTFGNYRIDGRRMRMREMGGFMHTMENAAATWADVERLRERWPGKIVVKGVMTGEDTVRAADTGVDAVIVSNHGGRQFDSQPSTIAALPEVVAAADGRLEVYLDGGVRRGSDVVKALALGADASLIGRPAAYGLAALGPSGVDKVFDLLREELETALGFVGVNGVTDLDGSVLAHRP
ncbi:alpha-hydroxy acid oxidase [Kitasatospora sp. NPDC092286]|uniref:alpha-hydroxy acid oxidase n=1 Tax=Kitasatospora sp. NPDC092286 TaxID=3364087 RepID=UPI003818A80D